jgi:hypothetical protein
MVEEYLKSMEFPKECDFCNFFSGNSTHPGKRPGHCNNGKSPKFLRIVKEKDTCEEGVF